MKSNIQNLIQYIVVSTSFPPLTCFYRKIYELSIAIANLMLRRVAGITAIYLRRGMARGEVVYGLSDLDLLVIVDDERKEERLVKEKVRATYDRLSHLLPLFGGAEKELGIYSVSELFSLYNDYDFYRHWFNDGKYDWKLLFGRDVVKNLPELDDSELYLPTTEELKVWWLHLNKEFTPDFNEPLFKRKYLWYKAISEASKIYLFICHGKKLRGREAALYEVRNYLDGEYHHLIEIVQGYLKNLTSREALVSDELMKLFVTLVGKAFEEMERKVYGDSKVKLATVSIPNSYKLIAESNLAALLQSAEVMLKGELELYLESVALIPQVEFKIDVLDNSDIDSFYMVLVQKDPIPREKLSRFFSVFNRYSYPQSVEPFIVSDGKIGFSLHSDNPHHCIKSPGRNPLFFSMLSQTATNPRHGFEKADAECAHCYLPPCTFEETIKKRIAKIDTIISSKDVYKMKTLEFLRFFWGAARTKLLGRFIESNELHIPLNSKQILEMLLQSLPEESDWLKAMDIEYNKELLGKESEAYHFFWNSVALLNNI